MFDPKQFDEIAKKLFNALPTSVQNIERDVQDKFRKILMETFNRLDLVTRDEFDVQCKVLANTREKVDSLQMQLDTLLAQKKQSNPR